MKTERTNQRKNTHQGGFTLVELIVSVGIFSIVMVISIGSLLVLIHANSKAQAEFMAMSNISFAIDSMTRNIRTGYDYYCINSTPDPLPTGIQDCSGGGGKTIVFTDGETAERMGYSLDGSTIKQKIDSGPWLPITSPDIAITRFEVAVIGSAYASDGDDVQPQAFILIEGYVDNDAETDTDFLLQTGVTQRSLDF